MNFLLTYLSLFLQKKEEGKEDQHEKKETFLVCNSTSPSAKWCHIFSSQKLHITVNCYAKVTLQKKVAELQQVKKAKIRWGCNWPTFQGLPAFPLSQNRHCGPCLFKINSTKQLSSYYDCLPPSRKLYDKS